MKIGVGKIVAGWVCLLWFLWANPINAQPEITRYLLKPDQVFDGFEIHPNWVVLVEGNEIIGAGPPASQPELNQIKDINLPGLTLMPGMIEGHGHLFLYPYNQTPWTEQVLRESQAFRTARATVHAQSTLMAGFTTFRDLGTEGAGYADVGLKQAIELGIIPGPRLLIATRALVTTGSYGPKGFAPEHQMPIGAQVADGYDDLIKAVREQIGNGADLIKVYADYRWGPNGEAAPTFTQEELDLIVDIANGSGRPVVAHAGSAEGMLRAVKAGVQTIEHGDYASDEVLRLMVQNRVALCPTLAATEAIMRYRGWDDSKPPPPRLQNKRDLMRKVIEMKVPLCVGGDVGVFAHGDNVRELELLNEYGMTDIEVIKAVTSGNAHILGLDKLGQVKQGFLADLIAVPSEAFTDVTMLREVNFIMKDGKIHKLP